MTKALGAVLAVLLVLGYSSSIWAMEAELKCSACEAVVRDVLCTVVYLCLQTLAT